MMLASMTALPLAFSTSFAEARGAGVAQQSKAQGARSVGRAINWSRGLPEMARHADEVILAELTPVKVPAAEAESLIDELRLQLSAQPTAKLSIRWQLTRPHAPR
ncbi:MAG: hypothetical protein L0Y50_09875 [Beijerinckiaceae bacterium]|nr:hypothetical protein [Beijerinckiaceae bacterium]